MKRKKPTGKIIVGLCDGDLDLIRLFYRGIKELPSLSKVYPNLDLKELLAFAAASWEHRNESLPEFAKFIVRNEEDIYSIFNKENKIDVREYENIYQWINNKINMPKNSEVLWRQLNPFEGKDLKERLSLVDPDVVQNLVYELLEKTKGYKTMNKGKCISYTLNKLSKYPTEYELFKPKQLELI